MLAATRDLLEAHWKVLDDPLRVRLTDFGKDGIELDIYAYVGTSNYAEYLEIAEELNLAIIDFVTKSGTGFAIPNQMLDAGR